MQVYRLAHGFTEYFIAAKDEEDAYVQGTNPETYPDIHYLPFTITQIVVPGHRVIVEKDEETVEPPTIDPDIPLDDEFDGMEKPELIAFVTENGIEHKPQWGEKRLREAARAWQSQQVAE